MIRARVGLGLGLGLGAPRGTCRSLGCAARRSRSPARHTCTPEFRVRHSQPTRPTTFTYLSTPIARAQPLSPARPPPDDAPSSPRSPPGAPGVVGGVESRVTLTLTL